MDSHTIAYPARVLPYPQPPVASAATRNGLSAQPGHSSFSSVRFNFGSQSPPSPPSSSASLGLTQSQSSRRPFPFTNFNPHPPLLSHPPPLHFNPQPSEQVPSLPTLEQPSVPLPPTPPAFGLFDTRLPASAFYGDQDIAEPQYYAAATPDTAGGLADQHFPAAPLGLQATVHSSYSTSASFDTSTRPSPRLPLFDAPSTHHSSQHTYHHRSVPLPDPLPLPRSVSLPLPPSPATAIDTENNMRRAVLEDPFNLFCPAGLATLPDPLTGGAFLPLTFVETARARGVKEVLRSGPCWSFYLYGPHKRLVAFCLHAECVKARQEENPVRGFMCPPNTMSMNRHYREQHHMFDPRFNTGAANTPCTKAEANQQQQQPDDTTDNNTENNDDDDDDDDSVSPPRQNRRRRKKRGNAATTPRKAAKKAGGNTPHVSVKTEADDGSGGKAEREVPPTTPRRRQKMSDHSTNKTWQEHADLQRHAPTTPVWQVSPGSSGSSACSSSSSAASLPIDESFASSSLPSSDHGYSSMHAASSSSCQHNVTRTRLSSVVYPYNLMSAMREFGGFLAHFVRLNWNLLAGQVQRLSQTNDLGRLVAQVHIHNTHQHPVRFQTAAGLISDNDGVCTARSGATETATRIRGVKYEVAMECRECNRRRMDVLLVGRHYILTDDMAIREMTVDEYEANQRRTGYRLPRNPTTVGVMRLEGDVLEGLRAEMEARYADWYTAQGMQPPTHHM